VTTRSQSFKARARRRNTAIAERNQKKRDANPLFEAAGILHQVVQLDERQWTALSVAYGEIEIGIATYERELEAERNNRRRYAIYRQMLCEAIGEENVEEVEADYDQRWSKGHSMQQWSYRLSHLNKYLATYLKRTPLDIFNEVQQRYQVLWGSHMERL
jgi:hypothetical protein